MKAQTSYSQTGYFLIAAMIAGFLILIASFFFAETENPYEQWFFLLAALLMVVPLMLFYKLTIDIDDIKITMFFGSGLIKKEYLISEIKSCIPVKNSIFYGYGIRKIPHGWLYNVQGIKGIELTFKNRNQKIRIGCKEPDVVCRDIIDRINHLAVRKNRF